MAVLINLAVIMPSAPWRSEFRAEDLVAELFSAHGWKVQRQLDIGPYEVDLVVSKGRRAFAVEVKAFSEGRRDRVIPLLSQAILQARAYGAALRMRPMAVVYVRDASPSLISQVGSFSKEYASDVAVGIISESGVRYFSGEGLADLHVDPNLVRRSPARSPHRSPRLFSDLNQWMLKVLLAPEIPERLLSAPRGPYRNVSELAGAARVSVMSAFRFVRHLSEEGFLDQSAPYLKLVRRRDLFDRWRSAALRSSAEMPVRFLIRGAPQEQLRGLVSDRQACLALFAAADALKLGHVKGVPPYVYVPGLPRFDSEEWKGLAPAAPGQPPDIILRQAVAPQSVFRGAVLAEGVPVSDVLQVWLDVSAHPSRGAEQAELIRRKVLGHVVEGPE